MSTHLTPLSGVVESQEYAQRPSLPKALSGYSGCFATRNGPRLRERRATCRQRPSGDGCPAAGNRASLDSGRQVRIAVFRIAKHAAGTSGATGAPPQGRWNPQHADETGVILLLERQAGIEKRRGYL
jgi:hypothetical protein